MSDEVHQQDAEQRASSLLEGAKQEAERLRATAAVSAAETIIEVQLPDAATVKDLPRQSRYSRNSAGLPRIGEAGGASVIATMNGLRNKLRESEEAAQ